MNPSPIQDLQLFFLDLLPSLYLPPFVLAKFQPVVEPMDSFFFIVAINVIIVVNFFWRLMGVLISRMRRPTVQYNDQQKQQELQLHPVEMILKYRFKDRKLLDEALTHSSFPGSFSSSSRHSSASPLAANGSSCSSYERLEFIGDVALGNAVVNYLWHKYPTADAGDLTLLRSVNVSTEKFARVAVKRRLHQFVRHKVTDFDQKFREFALAVMEEDEDTVMYGGEIKAPKVLADIVESIAAAVYIDCDFDLKRLWEIYRELMEPLVTLEMLQQQPEPVSKLFRHCQKLGKKLEFTPSRSETNDKIRVSVIVDGKVVAASSESSSEKAARLEAARRALDKLAAAAVCLDLGELQINERNEIKEARRVLHEICCKKKWLKPLYRLESEDGPDPRKFTFSVKVEVEEAILSIFGEARSSVKYAMNSAASTTIFSLRESGQIKYR